MNSRNVENSNNLYLSVLSERREPRRSGKKAEEEERTSNSESRSMRPDNCLICGSRVRETVYPSPGSPYERG